MLTVEINELFMNLFKSHPVLKTHACWKLTNNCSLVHIIVDIFLIPDSDSADIYCKMPCSRNCANETKKHTYCYDHAAFCGRSFFAVRLVHALATLYRRSIRLVNKHCTPTTCDTCFESYALTFSAPTRPEWFDEHHSVVHRRSYRTAHISPWSVASVASVVLNSVHLY